METLDVEDIPIAGAPGSELVPVPRAVMPPDFAALYEEHLPLMVGIAVGRFGISETDAETLAHEVFLDFILKAHRVTSVRAWLVASICNASRHYGRVRTRSEALPDSIGEKADPHLMRVIDMWPDQLAAREAIACTTARCQLVLRLRYFEEYSVPEIARELNISEKYAAKLVSECLHQAKRRYEKQGRGAKS